MVTVQCNHLDQTVLDVLNDCPIRSRESVESELLTFTNQLSGDSSEVPARILEHARQLVERAQVASIQQAWDVHTARIDALHNQYDRIVWDAVWKTLKDDAGQVFIEHRDKRVIAQDLHSQCWVKITENIDKFKDGKGRSVSGWLWKVSANVVFDWKRKQARRSTIAPIGPLIDASIVTSGTTGAPEGERSRPNNPWYKRGLRTSRLVRKNKRAALCQECNKVILVIPDTTFQLICGHSRGLALKK
jgi:DNA-directed RNA polymerase specialized sigma24 family protein